MNLPTRIYDLSQPVFANCPQYPDDNPRPVQIRLFYHQAIVGVNKEIVELSTHTGTHCDAPRHFFNDGATIDEVPLETYVGPAAIIDLRGKAPGSPIGRADLEKTTFAADDIVLLNTGWGHQRALTKTFLTQWPYLDGDGAQYRQDRDIVARTGHQDEVVQHPGRIFCVNDRGVDEGRAQAGFAFEDIMSRLDETIRIEYEQRAGG